MLPLGSAFNERCECHTQRRRDDNVGAACEKLYIEMTQHVFLTNSHDGFEWLGFIHENVFCF